MATRENKTQIRREAQEAPSPYMREVTPAQKRGCTNPYADDADASKAVYSYIEEDAAYGDGAAYGYVEEDVEPEEIMLLGRYRVVESRATGGFGEVEVCWDTRLQRRVAIKRIPLAQEDGSYMVASSVSDAIAEARTASMLGHPNIVTVYDFEDDGRYAYLVMEYVNGLSLSELLQRVEGGVLTFDECAHVLTSLGSALKFAHENGVLHLDIKPANILIDRSGAVKLGDFGMAALASAAGYGGARGGTVGYMPPEQIVGEFVDERTDIFSLSVCMWQALIGRNPFEARTAGESLEKIRRGPQVRLSKAEPELAGTVEIALLDALSPDAGRRMADASQFANLICSELGDAHAGQTSLKRLLDQLSDDEAAIFGGTYEYLPLAERAPWLSGMLVRLLTAGCCGFLAWKIAVPLEGVVPYGRIGVAGVCALCSLLLPKVGSLVIGGLGAAAFELSRTAISFPVQAGALVVPTLFVLLTWWAAIGRHEKTSTLALLSPAMLASPISGAGLAGFSLWPSAAFVTGVLSWGTAKLVEVSIAQNFDVGLIVDSLAQLMRTPSTWILAFTCGFAAAIASLCARRRGSGLAIFGQILSLCILAAVILVLARVENAGIWDFRALNQLSVAVALTVSVSLACALFGSPETGQEVD